MANKADYTQNIAAEIAIIILAAGASHRFGSDKLLTPVAGKRLIDWSVEAAVASNVGPILVVTNPNRKLKLDHHPLEANVSLIINSAWHEGLSSSILCGLQVLSATNIRAAIFTLSDQPLLTPEVYQRIANKFQQQSSPLIAASYDGEPRNPVLIHRELWETASRIQGDIGLAALTRSGTAELVECGDIASIADIDSPADLLAVEAVLLQDRHDKKYFQAKNNC